MKHKVVMTLLFLLHQSIILYIDRLSMALSAACLEELTSDLECDICTETFQDPRVLLCQHIFCLKCLEKLCGSLKFITCPLCRKETLLSLETGVTGLPKPITLNKLRDTLSDVLVKSNVPSQERQKTNTTCDVCDVNEQKPATIFCQECLEKMCRDCFKAHRRINGFETHESSEIEQFTRCRVHLKTFCKQYCQDCQVFVCTKCMIGPHKGHSFVKVSVVKEKWQRQLKTNLDGMKERLASLSNVSKRTDSLTSDIHKEYNSNIKTVSSWCLKITQNIQEVADYIKCELKSINREQTTVLEKHKLTVDENVAILDSQLTQCQSAMSTSDLEETHQICMELEKTVTSSVTLEGLPSFVSPVLNLPRVDLNKLNLLSTPGSHASGNTGQNDCSVIDVSKDKNTHACNLGLPIETTAAGQMGDNTDTGKDAAHSTNLGRWKVKSVISDKVKQTAKQIVDIVCSVVDDRIVVRAVDGDANLIIFKLNGDMVKDIDLGKYKGQTGIAFDSRRKRIILGCYRKRLLLYSDEGHQICHYNVKGVEDIWRITYCYAIDSLALTDVKLSIVNIISCSNYKRKRWFNISVLADSRKRISDPVCIDFDNTNKIFAVSDKTGRSVTLYDINGSELHQIEDDIIGKPNAISFSPEGVLFGCTFDTKGTEAGVWAITFGPKNREPTVHIIVGKGPCSKCNVTASVVDNNKLLVVSYQKQVFMVERLE